MHPYYSPYANDEEGKHYGLTNFQNPLARSDADVSGYRKERKKLFNGVFSLKYDALIFKLSKIWVLFLINDSSDKRHPTDTLGKNPQRLFL